MSHSAVQIIRLATDAGTVERAKALAFPRHWLTLCRKEDWIWGKSGIPNDPFLTVAHTKQVVFWCTCPVKRNPCKHIIALLLLFKKKSTFFHHHENWPDYLTGIIQKLSTQNDDNTAAMSPRSAEVEAALARKRQKNREKRLVQMSSGIASLEEWLTDLARQGLATLEKQHDEYWTHLSARLIDAKASALARRTRRFSALMNEENWHEKLTLAIGDLWLLVKAFQQRHDLPENLQDDLLQLIGINYKKEEILAEQGCEDIWFVAGQVFELEEYPLIARFTWLFGKSSRKIALILDYSFGQQGFKTAYSPGQCLEGELVFYPSAWPQRALFRCFIPAEHHFLPDEGFCDFRDFLNAYSEALAVLPWLSRFPVLLFDVIPFFKKDNFFLADKNQKAIPLISDHNIGWKLMAISGGKGLKLFGTWNGYGLVPISAISGQDFFHLPVLKNTYGLSKPSADEDLKFFFTNE